MTGFNHIERSRRTRGRLQRAFLCSRPEQQGFSLSGAEVVRRIFDFFIDGKSSYDIVTILNAEGVPSPFRTRYLESMERRRAKGLPEKKYHRCETPEEFVWTIATINRIARNAIYIGQRSSTFHELDPANPLPAYKRKDRKVYLELNVEQSDLRIVDDEKFHQVGKIIDERMFNKNGGISPATLKMACHLF